jgi:succinylarginine dihydrolase
VKTYEVNFDGIVGPTHKYGGLSFGNIASQEHRLQTSHPKQAALEGLRKMKLLADLGIPQAVLPPHERPCLSFLRELGFEGSDAEVIQKASKTSDDLLSISSSASAMWAANSATVSPSIDCDDGRVHFTPANLISTRHRKLEPEFTTRVFRKIFSDEDRFRVHDPLPDDPAFADEGAANHSRLCLSHGEAGLELFVYGRNGTREQPQKFPARQTRAACERIARQHGLVEERTMFVQQNPAAIDAGVFHNDVIAVVNESVLFCHERAYVDQPQVLDRLRERFPGLCLIEATSAELSMEEAVQTYLFNSQLVTLADDSMLLLCPVECADHEGVRHVLSRILADGTPVAEVKFIDVRQSMQNGGGPACLRLRVALTHEELSAIHQPVLLTEELYERLSDWIQTHYREELTIETLGDPGLLNEVREALEELSQILELGAIYPFQQ